MAIVLLEKLMALTRCAEGTLAKSAERAAYPSRDCRI